MERSGRLALLVVLVVVLVVRLVVRLGVVSWSGLFVLGFLWLNRLNVPVKRAGEIELLALFVVAVVEVVAK
jgi:hypothetical protein